MAVSFTAENHKYQSVNHADKIDWLSVTSFVALFKQKFDKDVAAAKATKNKKSKWYGIPVEKIIQIWENETGRAVNVGSWYHDQRETEIVMCESINRNGINLPIIRPIEQNGLKLAPDQNLTPGIYPEHLVYLKSAGICGQADRIEILGNEYVDVYDYKTNKEIKTQGFTNWEGISEKMLGPCSHLDNCNFNHYALQLSTYMYIVLKHNHRFKPGKMQLHHIMFVVEKLDEYGYPVVARDNNGNPIVDKVIPYDVPYLKREVQDMIKCIQLRPEIIKTGYQ